MLVGSQPAPGGCSCSLCLAIPRLVSLCHSRNLGPVALGFATDRIRILFNELLDVRARVPHESPPPGAGGGGDQLGGPSNPPTVGVAAPVASASAKTGESTPAPETLQDKTEQADPGTKTPGGEARQPD